MSKSVMFLVCLFVLFATSQSVVVAKNKNKNVQQFYTVNRVLDGDTVSLKNNSDNTMVNIRFKCIDAPEKSQGEWGQKSLKKLQELLPLGSQVTLEVDKKDLYGRSVAEIFDKKGTNINKQMTQLGFVVHYPFQKGCSQYQELEKAAKAKKVGVWSDSTFEMPWDYRKRKGIGARGRNFTAATTEATNKPKKPVVVKN